MLADGEAGSIEEIGRLERRHLDPEVRASAAMLDELLADDFLEIGASGRVFGKPQVLTSLPAEPFLIATVEDLEVRALAPEIALATYRLRSRTTDAGADRVSMRSSLWIRRGDRWQLRFHQGTLAPGSR